MSILKLKEYETHLKDIELSKGSIRVYMPILKKFDEYLVSNNINELTKSVIVDYKTLLIEKYSNKTTVNNKIIAINRYLKWAIETEHLFDLSLEKTRIKQVKIQNKVPREHITLNEFNRLINVIERKDILLFALVGANVGMRISEILSLKKSDINKKIIYVYNKGKAQPKSIPIWLRNQLKSYMKDKEDDELIFKLSQQRYRDKLKDAAIKARIRPDKVYPHSLRHLFGTDWVDNNKNIAVLQQMMGHSSIKTTEIYTKLGADDLVKHYKNQSKGKRSKALKK